MHETHSISHSCRRTPRPRFRTRSICAKCRASRVWGHDPRSALVRLRLVCTHRKQRGVVCRCRSPTACSAEPLGSGHLTLLQRVRKGGSIKKMTGHANATLQDFQSLDLRTLDSGMTFVASSRSLGLSLKTTPQYTLQNERLAPHHAQHSYRRRDQDGGYGQDDHRDGGYFCPLGRSRPCRRKEDVRGRQAVLLCYSAGWECLDYGSLIESTGRSRRASQVGRSKQAFCCPCDT